MFVFEKVQTSKMLIPSFKIFRMWVGQRMFVYQFRFILFLDGPNSQETHTKSTARDVALASFVYIFQHFGTCLCLFLIFRAFWEPSSLYLMKEETLTVSMIYTFSKSSYLRDFEYFRLYYFLIFFFFFVAKF